MKTHWSLILALPVLFALSDQPISASSPRDVADDDSDQVGVTSDTFYQDESLNKNGEWINVKNYGRCWQPTNVSKNWRPYTRGNFRHNDEGGWTWVSDATEEEWGWAPFHYGRWLKLDSVGCGWAWVPGTVWSGAWVSWRNGQTPDCTCVGWAPLPPEAPCKVNVGISRWVDKTCDIGPDNYTFVHVRDFGAENYERCGCVLERRRYVNIIEHTVNITNIVYTRERRIYCGGPELSWCNTEIRRGGGREIVGIRINLFDDPGHGGGRHRGGDNEIFFRSPKIVASVNSKFLPKVTVNVDTNKVDRGWKHTDPKVETELKNKIADQTKGVTPDNTKATLPDDAWNPKHSTRDDPADHGVNAGNAGDTTKGNGANMTDAEYQKLIGDASKKNDEKENLKNAAGGAATGMTVPKDPVLTEQQKNMIGGNADVGKGDAGKTGVLGAPTGLKVDGTNAGNAGNAGNAADIGTLRTKLQDAQAAADQAHGKANQFPNDQHFKELADQADKDVQTAGNNFNVANDKLNAGNAGQGGGAGNAANAGNAGGNNGNAGGGKTGVLGAPTGLKVDGVNAGNAGGNNGNAGGGKTGGLGAPTGLKVDGVNDANAGNAGGNNGNAGGQADAGKGNANGNNAQDQMGKTGNGGTGAGNAGNAGNTGNMPKTVDGVPVWDQRQGATDQQTQDALKNAGVGGGTKTGNAGNANNVNPIKAQDQVLFDPNAGNTGNGGTTGNAGNTKAGGFNQHPGGKNLNKNQATFNTGNAGNAGNQGNGLTNNNGVNDNAGQGGGFKQKSGRGNNNKNKNNNQVQRNQDGSGQIGSAWSGGQQDSNTGGSDQHPGGKGNKGLKTVNKGNPTFQGVIGKPGIAEENANATTDGNSPPINKVVRQGDGTGATGGTTTTAGSSQTGGLTNNGSGKGGGKHNRQKTQIGTAVSTNDGGSTVNQGQASGGGKHNKQKTQIGSAVSTNDGGSTVNQGSASSGGGKHKNKSQGQNQMTTSNQSGGQNQGGGGGGGKHANRHQTQTMSSDGQAGGGSNQGQAGGGKHRKQQASSGQSQGDGQAQGQGQGQGKSKGKGKGKPEPTSTIAPP